MGIQVPNETFPAYFFDHVERFFSFCIFAFFFFFSFTWHFSLNWGIYFHKALKKVIITVLICDTSPRSWGWLSYPSCVPAPCQGKTQLHTLYLYKVHSSGGVPAAPASPSLWMVKGSGLWSLWGRVWPQIFVFTRSLTNKYTANSFCFEWHKIILFHMTAKPIL